ncbi:hypothetical protein SAMN05216289_11369 [Dokdonella immobilis]|uniref:Uncharacterized protein n=1 Tax=Dokdonella immobilis TaxID=578942 RepID=A0A1I4XZ87_9GAMM|nr:hypothetical protein SAMN05216289_11369 [Dokdonella immobilis]
MATSTGFSAALLVILLFASSGVSAEPDSSIPAKTEADGLSKGATEPDSSPAGAPNPFTALISVENRGAISYGDSVLISVLITPLRGWDLESVRVHPLGELATIYQNATDDIDPFSQQPTRELGVGCRVESDTDSHAQGVPFLAVCQLTSLKAGWYRRVDLNTLLGSGKQQFRIQVAIREGMGEARSYYVSGSADFVSPKFAVILGGFAGALMWALFLQISTTDENTTRKPIDGWTDLLSRINRAVPPTIAGLGLGLWTALRSSLVGGSLALVLIVLANSTQGFDPPISLRIQDFWGGMLIGILSTPLSRWVRQKVTTLVPGE